MRIEGRLAAMAEDELRSILVGSQSPGPWGTSGGGDVDGQQVFVKRIPLTDVEVAHPRSTRNHFSLPNYYSYGVGSAGFGAWRELAAHEAMSGSGGSFPALLHHRVVERRSGETGAIPPRDTLDEYIERWNGSRAIRDLVEARLAASYDLWIVLEHVPHVVGEWLWTNQESVDVMFASLFDAVSAMHDLGVFHFDSHLGNVVTDGSRFVLTDFGLAKSPDFELTRSERAFLDRHRHYDYGVVFGHFGLMLADALKLMPTSKRIAAAIGRNDFPDGWEPALRAAFVRFREPIAYMADFFNRIRRPSKRARYDDDVVRAALVAAGVPIS